MSYDKYRTWPLPGRIPGPMKLGPRLSLEEQVLKDLDETKDDVEKLEILDSFAAYSKSLPERTCGSRSFYDRSANWLIVGICFSFSVARGLSHRQRPSRSSRKEIVSILGRKL